MSLQEKLQKLGEAHPPNVINWEARKKEWQDENEAILSEIKSWFQPLIASGVFQVIEHEKDITEEYLGTYKIKQLEFAFSSFRLVFEPVGRNVMGANGRIDVYLRGNKVDKYILVLLDTQGGPKRWFLTPFNDKSNRVEFNKPNMERILESWIDKNAAVLL